MFVGVSLKVYPYTQERRQNGINFHFQNILKRETHALILVMPSESARRIEVSQSAFIPYQQLDLMGRGSSFPHKPLPPPLSTH